VIPAPAPTRRESAATPRASRISTARRTRRGYATGGVPRSSESPASPRLLTLPGEVPHATAAYVHRALRGFGLYVYLRPTCVLRVVTQEHRKGSSVNNRQVRTR